ncbi:uncharacterized protein LOC126474674 [Schistocerca serialis cubense]|uniref:uncharacterized protein LOC126474674 n=1 Tax=Schistocerca serialis cubense TaxID=2023355 RepID=UPI00214E5570|nr:uncharacterized protein LOC126474674 [Schistocerca serialis cubense]
MALSIFVLSYCDRRDTLANLCEKITGDAALFSMFRVAGAPAPCPFDGGPPFSFTYSRGAGAADCRVPESRAEPCTDASRLLLRYQACPDVRGTESAVEELECLGSWRDGSVRYFVGRLEHRLAHSDEDRYRCFVYERLSGPGDAVSFNVAQSGDATCSGLLSASEGSRTMRLTNTGGDRGAWTSRCEFPVWVTEQPQWLSLDHARSYRFSARNAAATPASASPTGLPDQQQLQQPPHETFFAVAHITAGCRSGYVCLALYRRDSHVIELQESETWSTAPEDACQPPNFISRQLPFFTLITPSPRRQPCPRWGVYAVVPNGGAGSPCGALPTMAVGCDQPDLMQFLPAPCPEVRSDASSSEYLPRSSLTKRPNDARDRRASKGIQ